MQPHGRQGFDRYDGVVACVDSYTGAMSRLGESRSDSAGRQLRVRLNISASASATALRSASAAAAAATNSEVERLFGRLDNSTRQEETPAAKHLAHPASY
jgi:hypothetical protein